MPLVAGFLLLSAPLPEVDAGQNHQHKATMTNRTSKLINQRRDLREPDDCMNKSTITGGGLFRRLNNKHSYVTSKAPLPSAYFG